MFVPLTITLSMVAFPAAKSPVVVMLLAPLLIAPNPLVIEPPSNAPTYVTFV